MGSRAHSGTDALPSLPSWWRHEPRTSRITAVINFTPHPLNHLCDVITHLFCCLSVCLFVCLFPRKPLKMIRSVRRRIWGLCVVGGSFQPKQPPRCRCCVQELLSVCLSVCLSGWARLGDHRSDHQRIKTHTHILLWYRFWKISRWVAAAVMVRETAASDWSFTWNTHTSQCEAAVRRPAAASGGALSSCGAADLRTVTSWPHGREGGGQEVMTDYM